MGGPTLPPQLPPHHLLLQGHRDDSSLLGCGPYKRIRVELLFQLALVKLAPFCDFRFCISRYKIEILTELKICSVVLSKLVKQETVF